MQILSSHHSTKMTQIQNENNQDDDAGKLFVGGLSWETSQEKLQDYFSTFGEVVDCVVMKNTETGRSRGFGFVTFKEQSSVAKVLSSGPHELDKRTIDPKVCSSRGAGSKGKKNTTMPKVFLGGLPTNCTETDIRAFFSRYGNVNEVVLMYDQEKKKSRGFGFLSFESEDSVKQVCAEHYVKINGKQVECKHAEPRDKNSRMNKSNPPGNQWGGPGGMAGPGGWGPNQGPAGPGMGPGGQMPMNNNMMGGNYQGGWGGGPQQPGPYGPQSYGQNYQNWGGPGYGGPYGGGGGGGPGPQYGQGFGNYGPGGYGGGGGYGGNYNAPPAGPQGQPGPAGDGYSGPGASGPAANIGGPPGPATGPSGVDPGIGSTYNQENSNYGPSRGYGGTGGGSGSYGSGSYGGGAGGSSGNYNTGGSYGGGQGNFSGPSDAVITPVRSGGGGGSNQGYHPYRR